MYNPAFSNDHYVNTYDIVGKDNYEFSILVPCECSTGNIARGRGREPIKHEAQPSALFARDHAPSAIFP